MYYVNVHEMCSKITRKEMAIIDARVIGQRLISLRGNKTIKQVANDLGISESALSMYENGARIPRDEIKIRIASYYKRTVQSIFYAK